MIASLSKCEQTTENSQQVRLLLYCMLTTLTTGDQAMQQMEIGSHDIDMFIELYSVSAQVWTRLSYNWVTHWGLVTPYGAGYLGQDWQQAITWTYVDLPSVRSSSIHLRGLEDASQ